MRWRKPYHERQPFAVLNVDPPAARERLLRYVESMVFTPVEENGESAYAAEVVLKNATAALAGGRVAYQKSCGGRI